ncbi:MAG: steroid monooxygenase [Actinobacteria bacterium]|nr:steroid monooxygenase [Actinomycetota bacterium]NBU16730.1 steroid monooxygenase [Actinomycetota bacterium]
MTSANDVDVVVAGAGFSGLYLVHRLREAGFSFRVLESGGDVGGTWYWNRYPGARCDIPTTDYTYSWDPELDREWTWSEKYATQPEILSYAQHVAKKHDMYPHITFNTRVKDAQWDDSTRKWTVRTETGEAITCRHYIMATGCLSVPKDPDIPGTENFAGGVYVTGRWPHEGVDFTGRRVAVIGTGSSGIQSIPLIAEQASQVTVFQRTPNFSVPAFNGPVSEDRMAPLLADRDAYRESAKWTRGGVPLPPSEVSALAVTPEQRREMFEAGWKRGELFSILGIFMDQSTNREANDLVSEMIREKIRATVKDPVTAELLCPKTYPFGTKRPCLDTNYFDTYNKPHVRLVDLNTSPIRTITSDGITFGDETVQFDDIVYATGFDAMTGAIVSVDITGRNGTTLKKKWEHGPLQYLGLMSTEFPNFFMITGPGSPSVLSNMMVSIEQHVDWVTDTLVHMRDNGLDMIEPTETAEAGWVRHGAEFADISLMKDTNSWYMGANVPGKPRVMLPYLGGVDGYRRACNEVVERGYLGFSMSGPGGKVCNDGVIRSVQPDVFIVLDMMSQMGLPPMESMTPEGAREFSNASGAMRPPGPEVGEMVDGTLPGADGSPLEYRLYRPATKGPHPVVVYFHGGGWVIGSHVSDEPMVRDLCVRSGAMFVSVNYRHAPEARFPAAADDGYAALTWVNDHITELGGIPGKIAVAGWSAGGNVAAVAAQLARDNNGPALCGQLLLTPVTDGTKEYPSLSLNGEGYILTKSLMDWFWDNYADRKDRSHPKASPLKAASLAGLPPTTVVTAQFDPLRDEGNAYAEALREAGVKVTHIQAGGHIHTSISMVGVILSGEKHREKMAESIRGFFA